MREIVISRNIEDKKYRIISFSSTDGEFKVHEDVIKEFNDLTPFYEAINYSVRDDYDEKITIKHLFNSMEIMGYECSENVLLPYFSKM